MSRITERSTNYGRTWEPTEYHERSPLALILAGLEPYQIHDDGLGNLYRWRTAEEAQ